MTSHIYNNTRSIRQPQHTEVGEGDYYDDGDGKEDEGQGTRIDGDEDTKDGGGDGGKKMRRNLRRRTTSLRNPDPCSNQRNGSITLACQPTQHLLTRWNPPHRLLSTSDLLQWDAYIEDTS